MKIKDKIKTYSFWVSLTSAIILILKLISTQLGFSFDEKFASDLITTLCSILVILGIIVTPNINTVQSNAKSKDIEANHVVELQNENLEDINSSKSAIIDEPICLENEKENNIESDSEQFENFFIVETEQNTSTEQVDKAGEFEKLLNIKRQEFSDDINNYLNVLQNQINSINTQNNE